MSERRGDFPFGQVPVLEVGGERLTQSAAIMRYVGRRGGWTPTDPLESHRVDEVLNAINDLTVLIVKTFSLGEEERIKARDELVGEGGMIHIILSGLQNRLEGKEWFAGNDISEAEMSLYAYSLGIKSGRFEISCCC